ncbi:unnamed protein product [Ranitomeya imitator]|uniref:Uncharacterized protein n=1 Tax=Ranitomeya imitator TaxID=111125 RepID=A0ABN9LD40_9NEOB|nr:unnamed protein product [Ranitomeya imitator]
MFTLVTSEDIAESVSHTPIQRCLRGVQRRNKVLDFLPRSATAQQGPDRCCLSHWTISLARTLQRHGSLAISSSVTKPKHPTTGIIAITLALHICNEVHIAGFKYNLTSLNSSLHYYGNETMSVMAQNEYHNISAEQMFLRDLIEHKTVTNLT